MEEDMAWRTLWGIWSEGMDLSDSSGVYVNFGSLLELSEPYLVILSHSRDNITYNKFPGRINWVNGFSENGACYHKMLDKCLYHLIIPKWVLNPYQAAMVNIIFYLKNRKSLESEMTSANAVAGLRIETNSSSQPLFQRFLSEVCP